MGYSDQATATGRRIRGEPRSYDFRRPVRLAREHSHVLRVAMQTFGRQTSTVLTTSLRVISTLGHGELEELSYDEYLTGLPESAVTAVLSLPPWPGKALMTFDLPTMLAVVDHQLGGPGSDDQPDRPLTDIEQSLIRHLLARILRELAYALEPIDSVNPTLLSLESNAGFVQAAAATDPVVVARMELSLGTRQSQASLCLPFAMLSPALTQLTSSDESGERARARVEAGRRTQQRLSDVEVWVSVRFDPLRMTSQDIGRLTVGDVIPLSHPVGRPLSITSASTTFARATPGTSGTKLAVLVVEPE